MARQSHNSTRVQNKNLKLKEIQIFFFWRGGGGGGGGGHFRGYYFDNNPGARVKLILTGKRKTFQVADVSTLNKT